MGGGWSLILTDGLDEGIAFDLPETYTKLKGSDREAKDLAAARG